MLFAEKDQVVLMSHDGRWLGTDNDLELRLQRDGSVVIIDYGYGISKTRGKYKVKVDGKIVIAPDSLGPWHPMPCSIEKRMLVIRPPRKELVFAAARKAGVTEEALTEEAYRQSYDRWPLRQVVDKRAAVVKP